MSGALARAVQASWALLTALEISGLIQLIQSFQLTPHPVLLGTSCEGWQPSWAVILQAVNRESESPLSYDAVILKVRSVQLLWKRKRAWTGVRGRLGLEAA